MALVTCRKGRCVEEKHYKLVRNLSRQFYDARWMIDFSSPLVEEFHMKTKLLIVPLVVALGAMTPSAQAAGCLKGAAVGAVGGHLAHHHAIAGAAIGCAVGHHMAKKRARAIRAR